MPVAKRISSAAWLRRARNQRSIRPYPGIRFATVRRRRFFEETPHLPERETARQGLVALQVETQVPRGRTVEHPLARPVVEEHAQRGELPTDGSRRVGLFEVGGPTFEMLGRDRFQVGVFRKGCRKFQKLS